MEKKYPNIFNLFQGNGGKCRHLMDNLEIILSYHIQHIHHQIVKIKEIPSHAFEGLVIHLRAFYKLNQIM